MTKIKRYTEYCTGCGLCSAVLKVPFFKDKKGFSCPQLKEEHVQFCEDICPAGGKAVNYHTNGTIWGKYKKVYQGWALDESIRKNASSGGILTAVCLYLLENHCVDGIIQTRAKDGVPYETETVLSTSKSEVLACMGSRYAISEPLAHIKNLMKENKTYAFVGKPCDVSALRMYLLRNDGVARQIKYLFSFFCAGEPSQDANLRLLHELGCSQKDCSSLIYRGHGWPGYATAVKIDGTCQKMSYHDSWGTILGRDVRKSCRFCADGIGEQADVVCGDLWYLTPDKKPDFTEADGRNIIFARTALGLQLLNDMESVGKVYMEECDSSNIEDLKFIQSYQYERKACLGGMILALKCFGKAAPLYGKSKLKMFAKNISYKKRLQRFTGTLKRIVRKEI